MSKLYVSKNLRLFYFYIFELLFCSIVHKKKKGFRYLCAEKVICFNHDYLTFYSFIEIYMYHHTVLFDILNDD